MQASVVSYSFTSVVPGTFFISGTMVKPVTVPKLCPFRSPISTLVNGLSAFMAKNRPA